MLTTSLEQTIADVCRWTLVSGGNVPVTRSRHTFCAATETYPGPAKEGKCRSDFGK